MQKHHYLFHIQYLGFRYHGWLKQPNQLTVQKMVEKTLKFVLGHDQFKTLGGSRTDSKVSANHMVFSLFIQEELNAAKFLSEFNLNLPPDIRGTKVEEEERNTSTSFPLVKKHTRLRLPSSPLFRNLLILPLCKRLHRCLKVCTIFGITP